VRVDGADSPPPLVTIGNLAAAPTRLGASDTWVAEISDVAAGRILVTATHERGIRGMWLVRRAPEIPPPAPRAWDAGPEPPDP
jgi:hypothetical protein